MADTPLELTPNQVVAFRLKQAREQEPGLTQAKAAERLRELLGKETWTRSSYSLAESYKGDRVRHFSADELFAFSQAFGKPVWWFFFPPAGARVVTKPGSYSAGQALEAVLGRATNELQAEIRETLATSSEEDLTDFQRTLVQLGAVALRDAGIERELERIRTSGAEAIVEQATAPRLGDEYGGETGKRRLERDVEHSRQWRIERGLDPDDPAKELAPKEETEEDEKGSA